MIEKTPGVPSFTNLEEEITFLRGEISKREQELRDKDIRFETEDIVKEQVSRYRDTMPAEVLDSVYALSKHDTETIVLDLAPETHDKKIEELLSILEDRGIKNAMSVLTGLKDPHLEDDFHRFLVQYLGHGYDAKGLNISNREFRGLSMTLY